MISKEDLVVECESIISTLCLLVEHFGLNTKLAIEGETEEELKEGRGMYEQHLKFLGAVGLVNEFEINNNSVNVTVSPHILGFYVENIKQIDLIVENSTKLEIPEITLDAFAKMFPQDRDHCSECCPYIEDEEF